MNPNSIKTLLILHKSVIRQQLWIILVFTATTLTFFAGIDYGNSLGNDDWAHLYRTCQLRSPEIADRPLALFSLYAICPFAQADPFVYHLVIIAFRVASAYLLYVLVRQISHQTLFAFACGVVFAIFIVQDAFFIFTFLQQNDHVFSQVLTLLTLNVVVASLRTQGSRQHQIAGMAFSLILLGVTTQVREATLPLLTVIPILVTLADRNFSQQRLTKLALWIVCIGIAVARFISIIQTQGANYSAGTFRDFDVIRMLIVSKDQLIFAFRQIPLVNVKELYKFRLPFIVMIGILIPCFLNLYSRLAAEAKEQKSAGNVIKFAMWSIAGITASWLGFAAFLPTVYASTPIRTHMLSVAGESIAITGFIWMCSYLVLPGQWRIIIQMTGLAWVAAYGVVTSNGAQQELYAYSGTWENPAYFFRSLAHAIPMVKNQTLIVYIENKDTDETPFIAGWNFQYGVRYFYNDQITGIVLTDNIFGKWDATDQGIWVEETWIASPHTFMWNEIIVVTRDTSGHVFIVDQLPEELFANARQNLYRPFDLIESGFIPDRIRDTFPILSGPDWSAVNTLRR